MEGLEKLEQLQSNIHLLHSVGVSDPNPDAERFLADFTSFLVIQFHNFICSLQMLFNFLILSFQLLTACFDFDFSRNCFHLSFDFLLRWRCNKVVSLSSHWSANWFLITFQRFVHCLFTVLSVFFLNSIMLEMHLVSLSR